MPADLINAWREIARRSLGLSISGYGCIHGNEIDNSCLWDLLSKIANETIMKHPDLDILYQAKGEESFLMIDHRFINSVEDFKKAVSKRREEV